MAKGVEAHSLKTHLSRCGVKHADHLLDRPRKRSLAGRHPVDMLAEGSYEEVIDAIERLQEGAM